MKPAFMGPMDQFTTSGIRVRFVRAGPAITVDGWCDHCCGIQGETITLREFFDRAGITQKDCQKAFADNPKRQKRG